MTLSEFLLARIAEDEATAHAAAEDEHLLRSLRSIMTAPIPGGEVTHIVRWDPSRVLAECEAKRRIVGMHHPGVELCHWSHDSSAVHDEEPCLTLRLLALSSADHPDYDESWRP